MPSEKLNARFKPCASHRLPSRFLNRRRLPHSKALKPPLRVAENKPEEAPLEAYARDLTQAAAKHELEPLIGRETELEAMIQILGKKMKNNPLLLGEPGVGKSALAEGLAMRIASRDVPPSLLGTQIYALDLALLVAGTKFRGEFEERIKGIVSEAQERGNVILFIDELHTLIGAGGSSDGTLDAANILKPALARGTLRVIGATTYKEYRKYIEKDAGACPGVSNASMCANRIKRRRLKF